MVEVDVITLPGTKVASTFEMPRLISYSSAPFKPRLHRQLTDQMSPPPDPTTLADVILRSATEGYYPDSEEIAAANLTSVHLPTILESLNAAKDDIKVSKQSLRSV